MQETRNNCFGSYYVFFFRPETIVASFLHLMVLFFKVLLNHMYMCFTLIKIKHMYMCYMLNMCILQIKHINISILYALFSFQSSVLYSFRKFVEMFRFFFFFQYRIIPVLINKYLICFFSFIQGQFQRIITKYSVNSIGRPYCISNSTEKEDYYKKNCA